MYTRWPQFYCHIGQKYSGFVYEYDSEMHGDKPHTILIDEQSNVGHDGSIMYGELALLLTAMKNRAIQPAVVDESDSEAYS
jgi:hypothetical protein